MTTTEKKANGQLVNYNGPSLLVDYMQEKGIELYDPANGNMPNLTKMVAEDIDGDGDYWSPQVDGESKDLIYDGIGPTLAKSFHSDEIIEIEAAFFYEPIEYDEDGNCIRFNKIKSAAKALKSEVSRFPRGFAMRVTFKEEKEGKSGKKYYSWKIQALHAKQ